MSASDHLNNVQFSVYTGGQTKVERGGVYAHNGDALVEHEGKSYRNVDNIIGKLTWGMEHAYGHPDIRDTVGKHEIDEVWVHPEHRRQGIATAMHGFAKSVATEIHHSDRRTEAGDGWAQAQGAPPAKTRSGWHDRSGDTPG